eukprot:m.160950 g.160950  ORF g.160950 m.160950 type:complete len:327 (+) comp18044_c0_seq4:93-1073(+)
MTILTSCDSCVVRRSCPNYAMIVKRSVCLMVALTNVVQAVNLYCGKENCYEVLGLTRECSSKELKKAYRTLSVTHHPDRGGNTDDFIRIATAYETLRDAESRENYDYMLDHPDEYYQHVYRYYRTKAPKVNVTPIVIFMTTVISLCQWLYWSNRHNSAMKYALKNGTMRQKAKRTAIEQGRITEDGAKLSAQDESRILDEIILENLDLRGAYGKPSISDVLWVRLLISPYTFSKYVWWRANWYYRITILQQDYSEEDKIYLIQRNFNISAIKWSTLPEAEREKYIENGLWDKDNYAAFAKEREAELKEKYKGRYKQIKRWKKATGR